MNKAVLSLIIDLDELIEMMSIGTLMAYSIVAVCVLVLRYRPFEKDEYEWRSDVSVLANIFGGLDEQSLLERLFKPKSTCNHFNSHLVNLLTLFCGNQIILLKLLEKIQH